MLVVTATVVIQAATKFRDCLNLAFIFARLKEASRKPCLLSSFFAKMANQALTDESRLNLWVPMGIAHVICDSNQGVKRVDC